MFDKLLPYEAAHLILGAYFSYFHQFRGITRRASIRFELRDWQGIQADARERNTLYRDAVGLTTAKVLALLGPKAADREIWKLTKEQFSHEVQNFNTRNIAETFYNSVFRHSHKGISADADHMYVHATATYREFKSTTPIYHRFFIERNLAQTFALLLRRYTFDAPWEDQSRDIEYLARSLREFVEAKSLDLDAYHIESLKAVFYRNRGAYIVGRMYSRTRIYPLVIPILHQDSGLFIDALLTDDKDVSSIFSYNRSYFLVDVDIASEMVDFLQSFLPSKSLSELYNSIGFEKHGKTIFYRDLLRHMTRSTDQFVEAPGIKGMVMHVFTLPSYGMVFKLIKDRFAPPKQMTEAQVKEKYELVNVHDRVGRMTDTHMFENLLFERSRFSEELLDALMIDAPSKVTIDDQHVEIRHLYAEKKMTPLNMYLETATEEDVYEAIDGYGSAIKELAAVNIFPGDMLLKNFGVTRLKRVVFYDYDEIGFLTDYNFRRMPEPRDDLDELSAAPFFHVGPNDIFPEEFPRFLIGDARIREIFLRLHGDLFDVAFWLDMQQSLRSGQWVEVYPYRHSRRFINRYGIK